MISSNQPATNHQPNLLLSQKLLKIGVREIGIWRETVLHDEALFEEIYHLIYSANPRLAWHAAWVIDHVSEADPSRLAPYISEIIDWLPYLKISSLKRHFTRMLLSQKIPEDRMGNLIDVLYDLLSPEEAIAVRANALQLLLNIALIEPGLKAELISVTESILEEELTPGMISKSQKVLLALRH
ncbi:MAG: hypothetical protein WCI31_13310 [Prolixibacteraceae bacterium]